MKRSLLAARSSYVRLSDKIVVVACLRPAAENIYSKYYSLSTYGVANGADVMLSKTQDADVVTSINHLLAYHV